MTDDVKPFQAEAEADADADDVIAESPEPAAWGKEADRLRRVFACRDRERPVDLDAPAELWFRRSRRRAFERLWKRHVGRPIGGLRVLEVGCGHGGWLLDFHELGVPTARLAGIDLDPRRIEAARERLPKADLRVGCGTSLPWEEHSQDVVVFSTVFSSVRSETMARQMAVEAEWVLRAGGFVVVFDLRYPSLRRDGARRISRAEIARLFPDRALVSRSCLVLPPLARGLAGKTGQAKHAGESRALDRLEFLAPLRSHEVTLVADVRSLLMEPTKLSTEDSRS